MNLDIKIEDLISDNSSDFDIAIHIKQDLKQYIESLESIFEKHQGKSFLVKHTRGIDKYIKAIFKYALRKHFGDFLPLVNTLPITVVSLGSHAREQLSVYSDIDIMIVYKNTDGYNLKPIIETILQLSWDSGLKISHRVHEISDLYVASREDHTIKSAFIESCYLCGSKYLWINTEAEIYKIRKDDQKTFITSKIKERDQRLIKYPFNMEPNIKSSIGGLRDFNTLFWIAKTLFGVTKVKDLDPDIISDLEYSKLMKAIEFLFRVRVALHLSAGKKQDQLIFQFVPDVAKKLNLTQVKLMQKTFSSMLTVETTCEYLIKKITKDLYKQNNDISFDIGTKKISLEYFINLFVDSNDEKFHCDSTYINYLQTAQKKRLNQNKIKSLFYKTYLYDFFIALYKSKQLNFLFPPLTKVTHLPQFDGYHKYPVDIHSIRTLLALENINDKNVLNTFNEFDKEEKALLRVVSFLHDCGKGRRKDHSLLGAVIVKKSVQELGFSLEHQEWAYLLILHHTLMSNISNRQDIYSEQVIFSFISKLKDIKVLKLLYVLTFADIESVGPGAYSNFNAKLLNELFIISCEAFENPNLITEAQKRSKKEAILKRDPKFKSVKISLQKKILSIESNLLFFKSTPDTIINVASWVDKLNREHEYRISNDKVLAIEIIRKKSLNLGYLLGRLNTFNIATMDIFKFFNDTKYFRVEFLEQAGEHDILMIEEIISNSFDMSKKTKHKSLEVKKIEIEINCDHSKTYATMSVNTKDQPSLLSNIMSIFDDIGIDIASAKIQTIKNRARNLFLIEKNGKFCVNQKEIIKKLTKGV